MNSNSSSGSGSKVKDVAYARIEKAKQAAKSKKRSGTPKEGKPTSPSPQSEKQTPNEEKHTPPSSQSEKQTANEEKPTPPSAQSWNQTPKSNRSDETPKATQPISPSAHPTNESSAIKNAESSDEKKETGAKNNKMDEDTVFVHGVPVRAFSLSEPIRKSISEPTPNTSDAALPQSASSFADDELDEDLAKHDRITQSTSSIASDDFDHIVDRQFSAEDEADRNEELMSRERDQGSTDLSTSSISSSMVEVTTPSSVRDAMFAMDAMFASSASAFEEVQGVDEEEEEDKGGKGGQKDSVISLSSGDEDSDDIDEKPLSEFQVDDEADDEGRALQQDGKGSTISGFLRTYWCSILFSPFVIGTFVSIVTRSLTGKHKGR